MSKDIQGICDFLDDIFPDAGCELEYDEDYQLVIAVMLSAQTTDISVNRATKVLFSHFPTLHSLKDASLGEIEEDIKALGLFRRKAQNIKDIAARLLEQHKGRVPQTKEELMALPGIGNKTANVIRAELFRIPEFPVDTHVARIAKRLGLANEADDVYAIEKKLREAVPQERYILMHHQFIHFGRYFCKARNPRCRDCKIKAMCNHHCR